MDWFFYIAASVSVLATVMVITRLSAVHALLYLIVSLLSVALIFFRLGAPFIAALEVIIYAGAIMVLFVFVIMMLNLGPRSTERESSWLRPRMWLGPVTLTIILLVELIYILGQSGGDPVATGTIEAKQVGISLFGPYLLAVELASMLLLAGVVGAYHLGRESTEDRM
jgi:NADH-quinone oxidoreductase subunit J